MSHTMYTFRLHRSGVVLVTLGLLLFSALLFAAGYLSGLRRRPAAAAPAAAVPKPPALPKVAAPALAQAPVGLAQGAAALRAAQPGTPSPAAAGSPSEPPAKLLTLQAGMFLTEEEALELATRLTALRLPADVVPAGTESGPFFAVQVGRYATRREAAAAAAELSQEQGISSSVVVAPPSPPL